MPDPLRPMSGASGRASWIDHVDPRLRIVVAVAFSVVVVLADRFCVLGVSLLLAIVGFAFTGLSARKVLWRLVPLNAIMLVMVLALPLTTEDTPLMPIGPLECSLPGLLLGLKIGLMGNTIMLGLMVLLGSIDAVTLGHALSHLRVPGKLIHLLLFTVRYVDVLHREYLRLRAAMKVRAFQPRMNRHTYRAFGYLVGMLLVRSFDRSERIAAAMKCRGFAGRFYVLDHFAFSRRDARFGIASAAALTVLVLMEWM